MSKSAILSPSRWNRPLALMFLLVFAEAQMVALAGNDAPARDAGLVDSSFQCHAESSGTRNFPVAGGANATLKTPCFYRIYATRCDASSATGDAVRQACRTDSLTEFALHAGETRTVTNLPAGYRYCISLQAPPTLEECTRNPTPQ
jgi:hypothetical protein